MCASLLYVSLSFLLLNALRNKVFPCLNADTRIFQIQFEKGKNTKKNRLFTRYDEKNNDVCGNMKMTFYGGCFLCEFVVLLQTKGVERRRGV